MSTNLSTMKRGTDYERLTQRAGGYAVPATKGAAEIREAFRLWRRIGVHRPNYIRTIEVHLYVPEEDADAERAKEAQRLLDLIIPETVFADHETAADRVGRSPSLTRHHLWDTVLLRVPADWPDAERQNGDDTGMYLFDDKVADRWTLWIDYDAYRYTGENDGRIDATRMAEQIVERTEKRDKDVIEAVCDPMPDRPDEAVAKIVYGSVEKGVTLRHFSWHKIVSCEKASLIAHFTWVVPESVLNDPDIVALTALVERECRNAVLVDREAGALQVPAGGSA